MLAPKKIGRLIFLYIRRDLNFKQEKDLKEWRNLSEANEAFFQQETSLEYIRGRMLTHEKYKAEIWEKLRQTYPANWVEGAPRKTAKIIRILKYAAVFVGGVLILAGGLTIFEIFFNPATTKNFAMMSTIDGQVTMMNDFQLGLTAGFKNITVKKKGHGELLYLVPNNPQAAAGQTDTLWCSPRWRFELNMSEGSDIWMNISSMISYPANFDSSDSVSYSVRGEAFFKIPANTNKKYEIRADSMMILTSGASLDLRSNADSAGSAVILVSGTASVKSLYPANDTAGSIPLIPGQEVRLAGGKFSINEHPNIKRINGWKR